MRHWLVAAVSIGAVLLSGCAAKSAGNGATSAPAATSAASTGSTPAPAGSGSATAAANPMAGCTGSSLKTHSSGQLTVATDTPAYDPWFVNNKPSNGKGFESAVAYAVAKELGFTASQVHWTHATFDSVIAPTQKNYDFDINEVSITPKRAEGVDFSSGYYDVAQAVVVPKGSKYAHVTSLAGLKGAKLGAQEGTTSLDSINDVIKPGRTPAEFPTNDLAVQALKNKQIDGLVVDLPTATYVSSDQVPGSTIVGTVPDKGTPEQFGLVLAKGSSLTACVTKAVDVLREDGTLKHLQDTWLSSSFDKYPVLTG